MLYLGKPFKKRIKWSSRANYELKEILEFYNMRNETVDYSLKLLTEINNIVNTLSQSAFIGRLTENKKTRVVVMKVYLIFYEVKPDQIEILYIWDNRQDDKNKMV